MYKVEDHLRIVLYIINKKYRHYLSNQSIKDTDIYQVGCIGLWKACKSYNNKFGVTFFKYAAICIVRSINGWLKISHRHKRIPLNKIIKYKDYYYTTNNDINEIDNKDLVEYLCRNISKKYLNRLSILQNETPILLAAKLKTSRQLIHITEKNVYMVMRQKLLEMK